MQDLVGVRVADPAEDVRIGQRALERVVLLPQAAGKGRQIGGQHLEPLRIERGERRFAAHEMNRCLPLRSRLGEHHGPRRKVERGQTDLPGYRGADVPPPQPARNHQVHHDEQFVRERKDDALPHPAQPDHLTTRKFGWRRLNRPHDKRIADAQPLDAAGRRRGRRALRDRARCREARAFGDKGNRSSACGPTAARSRRARVAGVAPASDSDGVAAHLGLLLSTVVAAYSVRAGPHPALACSRAAIAATALVCA